MTTTGSSLPGSPMHPQSVDGVPANPRLRVVEPPKVVTPWMKSHLDVIIKTRGGSAEFSNESCGSSGSVEESGNSGTLKAGYGSANLYLNGVDNLKKRKAAPPLEEDDELDDSVSVPRGAAARTICNLVLANFDALLALKEDTTRAAVLASEIMRSQAASINYLRTIVLHTKKEFLDKEAFMKARSLLELTYELIPLKKYLSNKYNSLLEKHSVLVLELNRHFFTKA